MALNVDLNDDNWRNKDDKVYHQLTMEEDETSVVGTIGTASANSEEFREIRPLMYIDDLL